MVKAALPIVIVIKMLDKFSQTVILGTIQPKPNRTDRTYSCLKIRTSSMLRIPG